MKDVTFFETPADFRRWLRKHHRSRSELWVGFHKKGSGRPSITWPGAVDEALCFGWIDGVRKTIDGESYAIRFTPRRGGSTWSSVNTRRARELIRDGRMQPAGLRAFEARDAKKSSLYSFEQRTEARLGEELEARFRADAAAWSFFQAQPPGYRRTVTWWVMSAKREETRARRLQTLIEDSAAGRRIGLLRR
ncbi:MAG TPA: YdeI/OmpD-associated family protein [Thermoanaerobaculia bacterium]|nr:YdeI/OmpD-associated family protein [Thermoanaerobaculia bacterium]